MTLPHSPCTARLRRVLLSRRFHAAQAFLPQGQGCKGGRNAPPLLRAFGARCASSRRTACIHPPELPACQPQSTRVRIAAQHLRCAACSALLQSAISQRSYSYLSLSGLTIHSSRRLRRGLIQALGCTKHVPQPVTGQVVSVFASSLRGLLTSAYAGAP